MDGTLGARELKLSKAREEEHGEEYDPWVPVAELQFPRGRGKYGRGKQESNTADPSQTTWSSYPPGSQRDQIS